MDFRSQVWKRVWEMAFFGLKLGLDLEMWAAHPHQKFHGVPPVGWNSSHSAISSFWYRLDRAKRRPGRVQAAGYRLHTADYTECRLFSYSCFCINVWLAFWFQSQTTVQLYIGVLFIYEYLCTGHTSSACNCWHAFDFLRESPFSLKYAEVKLI